MPDMGQQVRRKQTSLTILRCSQVRRFTMQTHSQTQGCRRCEPLCQQRADESTQHIAHSSGSHAGIALCTKGHFLTASAVMADQTAKPFQ
jgi:hypothetical protein